MAAFHALLIGGGLLTLALVVMTRRGGAGPERLLTLALLALLFSGGSALHAGSDFNLVAFGANAFVYLGGLSLFVALLSRRRERSAPKIPAKMLFLRIALGVALLILGVIGGFIPILQGWVFILLGLLVLFPKAKLTEKVLHKAEPKVPRTVALLRRLGIGEDRPHP